jgi:hypothetical protein
MFGKTIVKIGPQPIQWIYNAHGLSKAHWGKWLFNSLISWVVATTNQQRQLKREKLQTTTHMKASKADAPTNQQREIKKESYNTY